MCDVQGMGVRKNPGYMAERKFKKAQLQGLQSARPRYEARENHGENHCTQIWEGFSDFSVCSGIWLWTATLASQPFYLQHVLVIG